jgi:uncharacterized protein YdaU (DUF1376 family)
MSKAPAYQFYPGDYIQDTRTLSLAAKGAWQDLLCFMWRSEEKGKLSYTIEGYSRLFGAPIEETKRVIDELVSLKICDSETECNGNVTLINRRMVRDETTRKQTNNRVKRFRNANEKLPCYENETPPSSSSSSSSKEKEREKEKELPLKKPVCDDKNKPPEKKVYLEYVLLSDDEYIKLVDKFGVAGAQSWIEEINIARGRNIKDFDKKYTSHYMTILSWYRLREKKNPSPPDPPGGKKPHKAEYYRDGKGQLRNLSTHELVKDIDQGKSPEPVNLDDISNVRQLVIAAVQGMAS